MVRKESEVEINLKIKLENIERCDGCIMITTDHTDICDIYRCQIEQLSGADWTSLDGMDIKRPQYCIDKFGR